MLAIMVMDVSNSTKYDNGKDIRLFLEQLTIYTEKATEHLSFSYTDFRMGDELFFVCNDMNTTLLLSYYIKLLWPFKNQPVKFGIAIGDIDWPTGNIEHWNDPLIKHARNALTAVKQSDISHFHLYYENDVTTLYNDIVFPYITEITEAHTPVQQSLLLYDLVYPNQKIVAEKISKTTSTVSAQLKRAHKRQLKLIEQQLKLFLGHDEVSDELEVFDKQFKAAIKEWLL